MDRVSEANMAPERSIFVTVKGAGVGTTFPGCYAAIGRDVYAFVPNENI
jgi:type I restriction enzyme S subunit